MPPVFHGSLTTVISEDIPVGTHILTVIAKDGDRGEPRNIIYDLIQSKKTKSKFFLKHKITGLKLNLY